MTLRKPLSWLSPPWRLIFVIIATSAILLIDHIVIIVAFFVFALLLFSIGSRPPWRLAVLVVGPTALLYFLGNFLFSPLDCDGYKLSIFTFNYCGFKIAAIKSLRIAGILFISLSWLISTPIVEFYSSLSGIKWARPWALAIARGLQLTKREFILVAQSLRIRGLRMESLLKIVLTGNWHQIKMNFTTFLALLRVMVSHQLNRTAKATVAWETHHREQSTVLSEEVALEARKLYVRYRPSLAPALHNVDLFFKQGRFYYFYGPAGSGKSTLLRTVGGIIPRVLGELAGEIRIAGTDVSSLTLCQYGSFATFVDSDFESRILGLTVGQEMLLLSSDEAVARSCLNRMGIGDLWDRETTKLSGGQQVRLILAGVLANPAALLIYDDPMDQLDPGGCADFLIALQSLLENKNRTFALSDRHYLDFKPHISDFVSVRNGEVSQSTEENGKLVKNSFVGPTVAANNIQKEKGLRNPQTLIATMNNVEVEIDGLKIIKGVSLDIYKGELLVVRGPNGSGKTTAMLALAGALKPSQGSVQVIGNVGYVFQDPSFQIVSSTIYEEIALAPRIRGYSKLEVGSIVNRLLGRFELDGAQSTLDLHPQQLKLLALASMSIDINLLILDEPTVGMDANGIGMMLSFVGELRGSGVAVIIISHENFFRQIADKVFVFSEGTIRPVIS